MFSYSDPVPEKIVVVPVEWGQLSKDTFLWYLDTLHLDKHCIHVCHVPDFRRHLQPGMTPEEVMEIMIGTNTESEQLKKLYESLIDERKVNGKFLRVGGNNRWYAIVEYCRRVDAVLLVLGTQPKPEREARGRPRDASSLSSTLASVMESTNDVNLKALGGARLKDVGPFAATVTHDVLDHCTCSIVVYREPEQDMQRLQSRRSSLLMGSFNSKSANKGGK